jgi:hypothetical protein
MAMDTSFYSGDSSGLCLEGDACQAKHARGSTPNLDFVQWPHLLSKGTGARSVGFRMAPGTPSKSVENVKYTARPEKGQTSSPPMDCPSLGRVVG